MQTALEIAFKHVAPTEDLKALIHEKAAHLETLFDGITSCHVFVRAPHGSQRVGNLFEVTVEVRVPGKELVVRQHHKDVPQHAHLHVAIRDAFAAMAREVTGWKAQIGGTVKAHDGPLQGKVVNIRHDKDFGQIIATDNRLIYFHKNSVIDGSFDTLQPRDAVELVVQSDESAIGPQASSVRRISTLAFDPTRKPSRRS
ncbi:HPF/RaiA family ribosome-associated protein [uncultured Roseicyclus sp.]|jgi:ribosome-associated translation inhibitor RaiA/cold shock CspA family protein|uniref:HPF/RaiA family ribosome-associated protein n=1 Tax=uncultured Roseicyclus sp. TaxID=543072 RepID=UPI002623EB79|nr:HPF/RaiA family ribosome-associated protein [uncultured Roseicyclus sp.]